MMENHIYFFGGINVLENSLAEVSMLLIFPRGTESAPKMAKYP
jgi:hypothetical protein